MVERVNRLGGSGGLSDWGLGAVLARLGGAASERKGLVRICGGEKACKCLSGDLIGGRRLVGHKYYNIPAGEVRQRQVISQQGEVRYIPPLLGSGRQQP